MYTFSILDLDLSLPRSNPLSSSRRTSLSSSPDAGGRESILLLRRTSEPAALFFFTGCRIPLRSSSSPDVAAANLFFFGNCRTFIFSTVITVPSSSLHHFAGYW
ncbi:unnamed protein product [Cuscuta epithymum]|uniref:Uncharacterized protein n=1 Tax=Cuscuta epithymum TaxID=186058 RepID=A0AAV0FK33_9ASTE|nr:unnamed protein product [Cuscuta epithymum]